MTPGGCFCERFPDGGGIEHMHVIYVEPGKHVILTGALGPLLYEATTGVMDVMVKSGAGGSQLVLDYRVAGFAKGGADKLAAGVDAVLGGADEAFPKLRDGAATDLIRFDFLQRCGTVSQRASGGKSMRVAILCVAATAFVASTAVAGDNPEAKKVIDPGQRSSARRRTSLARRSRSGSA